jgi:predicted Rdx family selenoprotein
MWGSVSWSGYAGLSDDGCSFRAAFVAKEVVATLVGSIGLIAAVPITTGLAALLASSVEPDEIEDDGGHGHSH